MFIAWSVRGLIAGLILITSFSLPVAVGAVIVSNIAVDPSVVLPACMSVGLGIGGAICWRLGRKWHLDPKSDGDHTLYWIPVEYCGVLAIIAAVGIAVRLVWSLAQH